MEEPGYDWVGPFLAEHRIEVVASLPCHSQANVDEQRGDGVFESSIRALQALNGLGYGQPDSGLVLHLMQAYCRSKLGNLWIAAELVQRRPSFEVRVVHPGVVATNLGGDAGSVGNWFKRFLMISPEEGAQMPLICATQPGLENGGYWHNVHGRMYGTPARPSSWVAMVWNPL